MDLGISGRRALVLGAGGGLGGAIAAALAREGVVVAAADRDEAGAARVVDAIAAAGGTAAPFACDLADVASLPELVAGVVERLGPIDILVNNTGGPPPSGATGVPTDTWREHFASMVLSVITLTDLVLPGMRERGWGRVLTSTSSGVIAPIPGLGVSNVLRASLHGWSKTVATEVGGDGVTVNVILPGRIATARITALDAARAEREGTSVEAVSAASRAQIPVGRYGRPEEYGDAAAFLVSDRAAFITGTVLRVDGGMIPST
jgi:3-oxoacyl-[acyl-carrier protein] reductase